jgi:hypothetical protein
MLDPGAILYLGGQYMGFSVKSVQSSHPCCSRMLREGVPWFADLKQIDYVAWIYLFLSKLLKERIVFTTIEEMDELFTTKIANVLVNWEPQDVLNFTRMSVIVQGLLRKSFTWTEGDDYDEGEAISFRRIGSILISEIERLGIM